MWPILMSIKQLVSLFLFWCRCHCHCRCLCCFVMQCAFKSPVKMTANESEMCFFMSDCVYANVSVEKSSNGRRHNDTATFRLVQNSIGNFQEWEKKEKWKTKRKKIRTIRKHPNDYNHVFYAFLCVDFNGINLWSTMPLQTPMTNRSEKKHIHLSLSIFWITHRLGRLLLFCWSHWYMYIVYTMNHVMNLDETIYSRSRWKIHCNFLATFYYFIETSIKITFGFSDRYLSKMTWTVQIGHNRIDFCYSSTSNKNFPTQTE